MKTPSSPDVTDESAASNGGSLKQDGWEALDWWPECPWPEEVWTGNIEEAGKCLRAKIANDDTTTAVSGVLMRHGWRLAEKAITERLLEAGIVPPNDAALRQPPAAPVAKRNEL